MAPLSRSLLRTLFCAVLALPGAVLACAPDYFDGLSGTRKDVLVVVNENSPASCEVGRYYAERRGIARSAIARVYAPTNFFIDWRQYEALREQLLQHMQDVLAAGSRNFQPAPCAPDAQGRTPRYCEAAIAQLRSGTGINYLVTTLGVPTRVRMDYPGGDLTLPNGIKPVGYPTSLDNLLRLQLANFHDYDTLRANGAFGSDGRYYPEGRLSSFGADGHGMRAVNTLLDQELVVGRIDGLSLNAAKRLVDRALARERAGVAGRFYIDPEAGAEPGHGWPVSAEAWPRAMFNVFGEARPACLGEEGLGRPDCRAHLLPGNWPEAPAGPVGALMLADLYGSQASLGRFDNLLKLRREDARCLQGSLPLCTALIGPEREACRQASEDEFGEIDTRCVGVAEGFVGTQLVSYPVAYLAAQPTGWGWGGGQWLSEQQRMEAYGEGYDLAFPVLREGDGHDDAVSLWFGPAVEAARPDVPARCYPSAERLAPAALAPCGAAQQRRVALAQTESQPDMRQLPSGGTQRYRLSLWYKSPQSLVGRLRLRLQPAAAPAAGTPEQWLDVRPDEGELRLAPAEGWTRVEANFTISRAEVGAGWDGRYQRLGIDLAVDGVESALGLDDVSLLDESGRQLVRNGQFDQGHQQVDTGDYAANYLSRLNGAAFFGSVSHYQSGGRSFFSHRLAALGGTEHFQTAMRYFVRGLPVGDAVWLGERNLSGVLYGDPLYSPLAVRLEPVGRVSGPLPLIGVVRNGEAGVRRWSVDVCEGADAWACSQEGRWRPTGIAGEGSVPRSRLLAPPWTPPALGLFSLRLRAECEVDGRAQTFSDFVAVEYRPGAGF